VKRVLLLSPSAKPGGAERGFLGLARQLPAHGYEAVVALLEDGPLAVWLEEAGCAPVLVPAGRFRRVDSTVRVVARLARLARRTGVSAVVSSMSKGHVYGGPAALVSGVPAVWWQRDVPHGTAFERVATRIPAAAVVCVSPGAAEAQRRLTPHVPVASIHSGVPVDAVRARSGAGRPLRDAAGWNGEPVVGIVGRLQEWKGQDVFLRAARIVASARPDVRFAVVGGAILGWEGDYPRELERLALALGLDGRVLFTGHRDDPWDWLDALDVVVHASAEEPFGRVLVEALALGKPLVATEGPGPSRIVQEGVSGLLVPPRDPARLAEAVECVLGDAALRERLAAAGPERAQAFSEERMGARFASLLDGIVDRRPL
jgi:glycosyltransferase involved in cell wall biosynthesis